jgi:hypothetical protein
MTWDFAWLFPLRAAVSAPMIGIGIASCTPWLLIAGLVFLVIGLLGLIIFS